MTRKTKSSLNQEQGFEFQQASNSHRTHVDSLIISASEVSLTLDTVSSDDELVPQPQPQPQPIPINDYQQRALDIISQPVSMKDALDCDRQLQCINEILLNTSTSGEVTLSQAIVNKLTARSCVLNNHLLKIDRESSSQIALSSDIILLLKKNKQLWDGLDESYFKLRRPFVSYIQIYFDNLLRLASGNFKPYSHKLEHAEYVAEAGHLAHTFAGFLEAGYELFEKLGYNMPRYMHQLQPAMACAFSIAFPIIPLISGVYTIVTNELLIKKAKRLSHNLSKITSNEREQVYEAFFLRLSHLFKDQISNGKPNIILTNNKNPTKKKNKILGVSSMELWRQALPYIAMLALAKMPLKKNIHDVNHFIDEWMGVVEQLIKYRGVFMPNQVTVSRETILNLL